MAIGRKYGIEDLLYLGISHDERDSSIEGQRVGLKDGQTQRFSEVALGV